MFKDAFLAVIHSPVSFFDTTPLGESICPRAVQMPRDLPILPGRIVSRLSKDQDTVDTEVSMMAFQVRNNSCLSMQLQVPLLTQISRTAHINVEVG